MNRAKLKELDKRIKALTEPETVEIARWIEGRYEPMKMPIKEARELFFKQISENNLM